MVQHTIRTLGAALVLAMSCMGCAGAPVPVERVASAQAAIRSAQEVGTTGEPVAALHLRLAKEEFARAERLIAEGENERARGVLLRAEADAELALALSREATTRAQADSSLARVRAMRSSTR